jgi:hypothetical protein
MFGGFKKAFSSPFKAVKSLIEGPKPFKTKTIKDEDPDIANIKAMTGGDDVMEALRKRIAAETANRGRAGLVTPLKGQVGLQL